MAAPRLPDTDTIRTKAITYTPRLICQLITSSCFDKFLSTETSGERSCWADPYHDIACRLSETTELSCPFVENTYLRLYLRLRRKKCH